MSTTPNETAVVRYDGQEFSIDSTVAASDSLLRSALAAVYPGLATAAFTRTQENGRLVVTAAKTAGTKGGPDEVARRLVAAREHVNPAVRAASAVARLFAAEQMNPSYFARLERALLRAASQGLAEREKIDRVRRALGQTRAEAAPVHSVLL